MSLQLGKALSRPWEQAQSTIRTNFELIELTVNSLLNTTSNVTNALDLMAYNAGAALVSGVQGFIYVPYKCNITGVVILSTDAAATAGSVVIDLWRKPYASYPPVVDNTIVASAKPTMITARKFKDVTLSGWTKSLAADDTIAVQFDSVSTFTRLLVTLLVERA